MLLGSERADNSALMASVQRPPRVEDYNASRPFSEGYFGVIRGDQK